jgi:hypothetical protein
LFMVHRAIVSAGRRFEHSYFPSHRAPIVRSAGTAVNGMFIGSIIGEFSNGHQ